MGGPGGLSDSKITILSFAWIFWVIVFVFSTDMWIAFYFWISNPEILKPWNSLDINFKLISMAVILHGSIIVDTILHDRPMTKGEIVTLTISTSIAFFIFSIVNIKFFTNDPFSKTALVNLSTMTGILVMISVLASYWLKSNMFIYEKKLHNNYELLISNAKTSNNRYTDTIKILEEKLIKMEEEINSIRNLKQ